ncbi:unnamed protein product [Sphagnum compactum]
MTVQICFETLAKGKLQGMGEQLERLIGGITVHIREAIKTIVMWQGQNSKCPNSLIPHIFDHFNKHKVFLKSTHEQPVVSLNDNISQDSVKANEPNFKDWGDESESNSENDISSSDESDEYTSSSDSDDENSNDLDNKHVLGSEGVLRSAD